MNNISFLNLFLTVKRIRGGDPKVDMVSSIVYRFLIVASPRQESKRAESLLSIHAKKMKRKAAEDSKKPVERKPFDRDADLQVNRFDEAQKKALLKKSQELNTRFSHSKDRMFL